MNDNEEMWTFYARVEGRSYVLNVHPERHSNRPAREFCRIFRLGRHGRKGAEVVYDGVAYRRALEQVEDKIRLRLNNRASQRQAS